MNITEVKIQFKLIYLRNVKVVHYIQTEIIYVYK